MVVLTKKPSEIMRLDQVQTRDLYWFWHPYLPSGALSMLHGPGGMGKTHITCAIATTISNGMALPGQTSPLPAQNVLMLSAEDDLEVVLAPRLNEMGADGSKIFFPKENFVLDKRGVEALDAMMEKTGAKLVFIDPIVQYMGGKVDMNRMNEVRSVMNMLSELARKHKAAIVFVHHDRKSAQNSTGDDQDSAAGSADFRNAVRSSLKVAKYPDGRSVVHHDKSNWSKPGASLTYEIGEDGFEWGEVINSTGVPSGAKARPRAEAGTFIQSILKDGPVKATEVELQAKDLGFNKRTLARAKAGIAESYLKVWPDAKVWYWRLIGDTRPTPPLIPETPVVLIKKPRTPKDQVVEINHGAKISTVGQWLDVEVEGPPVGSGADGRAEPPTPRADQQPDSDDGRGGRDGPGTGNVASDFQREIEEIMKREGIAL